MFSVSKNYFCQLILLFNLFLLLFIDFTALFGIIHESHYTISVNFYLYIQYFQQKKFQFQQNKQISNEPLVMHDMLRKIKQNLSGTSAVMLSLWTPIQKKKSLWTQYHQRNANSSLLRQITLKIKLTK